MKRGSVVATAILGVFAVAFAILYLNARAKLTAERSDSSAVEETTRILVAEERSQLVEERRLAKHRFDILEGVIAERDQAFSMYIQMAQGSAGAQALLLRELDRVVRLLNVERAAQGKPAVQLPAELRRVAKEFRDHADNIQRPTEAAAVMEMAREAPTLPEPSDG